MAANTPATSAHQPQGWLSKEEGEARSAIATDESQLKAKSQQLQGEANQAIATDQSALMQKDEDLVTSMQQLSNLPPEQTLLVGQKVLQSVQAQAGTAGLGGGIAYVFLQSAYASAGITSLRGQGFVLARAGGKWAAPAYVSVYKLGAGLSIGGEIVESLIVLHRKEDLADFFKPDFVIKDYVNAGANVPEQAGAHAASGAPVVFSGATGLTLKKGSHDLNGAKVKAHTAANEKAYGKDATPEKILTGVVPVPPGLEPLHQALEALSAPQSSALGGHSAAGLSA